MQIDLSKNILDLDGNIINAQDGKPAIIQGVVVDALLATFQDESNLSGEEKLKRFELALKIKKAGETVCLVSDEVAYIKKLVGRAYGALIVGQTWKVLEGE
jgi:hypothetical protein